MNLVLFNGQNAFRGREGSKIPMNVAYITQGIVKSTQKNLEFCL